MESTRLLKVSRLLQKELGSHLQLNSRSLCLGKMVSVTGVRVSPDLSVAHVHLSIFPSVNAPDVIRNIKEHTNQIRSAVGNEVRHQLRVVPAFDFQIDDSLDYIEKIDQLLKK